MIDLSSQDLERVRQILKRHVPDCEIRVFGSRILGKAKKYSDLDLAVVGKKPLPLKILEQLKEAFADSDLSFRVDILDWNTLSREFREVIAEKYEILLLN